MRLSIKLLVTAFSNSRFKPMVARPFRNSGAFICFGIISYYFKVRMTINVVTS